ncbi:uncharacterized protein LOC126455746 [Schistocerca serialis cubense]|uniref:uncharacterized protein LOC126455746 n=1 Tax=Schistocerca serialis cubense TaxID=2023355 RepID=UPI00214E1E07|nr:uncharacterized protein LOC126455746 [Schistocerca serialis cubense]
MWKTRWDGCSCCPDAHRRPVVMPEAAAPAAPHRTHRPHGSTPSARRARPLVVQMQSPTLRPFGICHQPPPPPAPPPPPPAAVSFHPATLFLPPFTAKIRFWRRKSDTALPIVRGDSLRRAPQTKKVEKE